MEKIVGRSAAPPMGDIRRMGPGDVILVLEHASARADWGRYLDALSAAISRGATVRWVRES